MSRWSTLVMTTSMISAQAYMVFAIATEGALVSLACQYIVSIIQGGGKAHHQSVGLLHK